nr:arylamine n-acetyltransferase, pineal gland isozyme nat-10 [Quercus suber]POE94765.1 arylamine n-acetyltransferase, pineal gland isozyme nat-10 [Quercus suber]
MAAELPKRVMAACHDGSRREIEYELQSAFAVDVAHSETPARSAARALGSPEMMGSSSSRLNMTTVPDFKFDRVQLTEYYSRICLPPALRIFNVKDLPAAAQHDHLTLLARLHCVKFPWENIDQHYTHHRTITIRPLSLFRKLISGPSPRGGYCMENNTLIHFILHSLGFTTYLTGARIYDRTTGLFGNWSHCVSIVTIGGTRYLVDNGLDVRGPMTPKALGPEGTVSSHIAPSQCRLVRAPLPGSLTGQDFWMYQWRPHEDVPTWTTQYCFAEVEFTLADAQGMNLVPMTAKTTFFAWKLVCVRFTVAGEVVEAESGPGSPGWDVMENAEIDGTLCIDNDKLTWKKHGKKVLELKFRKEEERVAALQKYFGIVIEREDWEAIEGSAAAIGARAEVS